MLSDTPTAKALVLEKQVHYDEKGDLVIPIIGVPFRGVTVGGKGDLIGDVFTPETDIGPVQEVTAFFDHGKDEEYLRGEIKALGYSDDEINRMGDIGFGKQHIGVAHRGETTPEGIIYRVVVNRHHKYLKLLERLAREGIIGASSGAKNRIPNEPGQLKYFPIVEMTVSPTQMNPYAQLLAKSLITGGGMEENAKPNEAVENQPVTEATSATPITDALRNVEKSVGAGDEKEPSVAELVQAAIEKSMSGVLERLAAVEKSVSGMNTDMQTALPELANMITKSLRGDVRQEVQKSEAERTVEKSAAALTEKSKPVVAAPVKPAMKNWPGA